MCARTELFREQPTAARWQNHDVTVGRPTHQRRWRHDRAIRLPALHPPPQVNGRQKRYIPAVDDLVVGVVTETHGEVRPGLVYNAASADT